MIGRSPSGRSKENMQNTVNSERRDTSDTSRKSQHNPRTEGTSFTSSSSIHQHARITAGGTDDSDNRGSLASPAQSFRRSQTASSRIPRTSGKNTRSQRFRTMFTVMGGTDDDDDDEGKKSVAATENKPTTAPDTERAMAPADKRRKSEDDPTRASTTAPTVTDNETLVGMAGMLQPPAVAKPSSVSPQAGQTDVPAATTPANSSALQTPRMKITNAKLSRVMEAAAGAGLTVTVRGNRYIKLDVIGRGGSSKVYRVLGQNMEIYALKRVNLQTTEEQKSVVMGYKNEIDLLRKLQSNKCVIQLIDAEIREEHRMIDIVLEFGETDLAKMLRRYTSTDADQHRSHIDLNIVRMFWGQMLGAVQAIHEERIVHGDLKPANFVLVRGVLKLIDFGIAKQISQNTTHIVREDRLGTLSYMAPEAIGDLSLITDPSVSVKVSRAADTWSLGCILYQMVYGYPPFNKIANSFQKVRCICDPAVEIEYPPRDDVPFALVDTLKCCLRRNPVERMSIPDLLKHPFLTGEPLCPHCPHCKTLLAKREVHSSSSSSSSSSKSKP